MAPCYSMWWAIELRGVTSLASKRHLLKLPAAIRWSAAALRCACWLAGLCLLCWHCPDMPARPPALPHPFRLSPLLLLAAAASGPLRGGPVDEGRRQHDADERAARGLPDREHARAPPHLCVRPGQGAARSARGGWLLRQAGVAPAAGLQRRRSPEGVQGRAGQGRAGLAPWAIAALSTGERAPHHRARRTLLHASLCTVHLCGLVLCGFGLGGAGLAASASGRVVFTQQAAGRGVTSDRAVPDSLVKPLPSHEGWWTAHMPACLLA
jgi:hypothetical protein